MTQDQRNTRVMRGYGPGGRPAWAPNYLPPGPIPRPFGPPLRATDRDRDAAIDVLQESYITGRLTAEEHAARVGQAMAARTYVDLDRLTADPPMPRRTNGYAVAALACGAAQPLTLMLTTIPAIVFGHVARRQIRETGEDGSAMATWGLILGWGGAAAIAIVILLFVVAAVLVTRSVAGP